MSVPPTSRGRRGRRGDRGQSTLELVRLFPLLLVVLFLVLQTLSAVFALSQAGTAARAASRAASLELDPAAAARAVVAPSLDPQVSGAGTTWTVSVRVPVVFSPLHLGSVTRSATFPATEG